MSVIKQIIKLFLSNILRLIVFYKISFFLQKKIFKNKFIRVVNYHCTNANTINNFKLHVEYFKNNYINVDEKSLKLFFEENYWPHKKPGLIICFDDGLNCNIKNCLEILDKNYLKAWFMLPIGLLQHNEEDQNTFILKNLIDCYCKLEDVDYRRSIPLKKISELIMKGHTISSHTINHVRMSEKLDKNKIKKELLDSKDMIESYTDNKINSFTWVGAEEENYNIEAIKLINKSDYQFSFTSDAGFILSNSNPKCIGRINIESTFSLNLCLFQLSGLVDLFYYLRRSRILKKFKLAE